MGSPGMDELRWLRPVRPGDSLHVEAEVLEQRASSKRPDRGTVTIGYSVVNHEGESVMTFRCLHIFRKAPEAA
jgi:acyl dehydratase